MLRRRAGSTGSLRAAGRESLGRKLAIYLLPLVLVPLILLGAVAYLRARAILRQQVHEQMTSTTQSQISSLAEWAVAREQHLSLASQRAELRDSVAAVVEAAARGEPGASAVQAVQSQLADLRSQGGQNMFSELLLVRSADARVLAATVPEWAGQTVQPVASGLLSIRELTTTPVFNDAVIAPASMALVTTMPVRTPLALAPDVVLLGVNSGLRLGELVSSLQVFSEQQGLYRIERGETFLVSKPDVLISLAQYSTAPSVQTGVAHPVMSTAEAETPGSLEYSNLAGVGVLGAYQWVPGWNLAIVNEVPQSQIYTGLSTLAPFTAGLIGVAAIFTVVVVLWVTNRLLRPLVPLTEFAGRISRGDWDYRVPEGSQDELGVLARAFNRMADDLSGMYRSLEARVEERTRQVRTASEVARAVISTPNLEDLMRRAVDVIRERFGYYHAAIFMLDDSGEKAILRSATGEVGAALIARGHALGVGSASIIGWVTSHNEPRVASDVSRDPVHFKSELLPGTRSEAAVPLQVGGRVLGALDVQSLEANAFNAEDLAMLQTLADQLSAAIQNARLAQTSALAADRARLITQATTQMAGVLDMSRVLETAAGVLHRALGQPEIVVRLARPGDGGSGEAPPEPEELEAEP
jgi:HAMP domain-containing protein